MLHNPKVMAAYLGTEEVDRDERATLRVTDLRRARAAIAPCCTVSTLEIPPGEITTLLGPNGAGKSTLVLTIGGMLKPTGGTIAIGDVDITGAKPDKIRAAGVAVVPEGRRLLPSLTVEDNLKVATYNLPDRRGGGRHRLRDASCSPSSSAGSTPPPARSRAASSRWSCWRRRWRRSRSVMVVDELSLGLAPVVVKRLMPVIEHVADERHRRAADRAVRPRRALAGDQRLRDRGRRDPVLGHRRRAARQPRHAALGVPARLQALTTAADAVAGRQGRRRHRRRIRHRSRAWRAGSGRRHAGRDGRHRATGLGA